MGGILQSRMLNALPYSLVLLGAMLMAVWAFSLVVEGRDGSNTTNNGAVVRQSTDRQIEALQGLLLVRPTDSDLHVQLGNAYLQKGRETGEPRLYDRAEDSLLGALELDADNSSAINSLGSLALSRHQFAEALEWAERSLAINGVNPDAYGVLGSAQAELGRYSDATNSFQTMVDLKPNLASYANVAYIRKLSGDTVGAIQAMKSAVTAAPGGNENSAWANNEVAEIYFDAGNIQEAEKYFQAALNDFPSHHEAMAGLAHVRTAQGDFQGAIELFEGSLAVVTEIDTLGALGDLLAASGRVDEAQLQYEAVVATSKLRQIEPGPYNRELAMFYADHDLELLKALDLALLELEVRRDIYGYDALAWTLYKSGRFSEAAEAIAQAMRLGTQDAALYYHSGMIRFGLGDRDTAREHLEHALALNPHFSLLQSDVARRTLAILTADGQAG